MSKGIISGIVNDFVGGLLQEGSRQIFGGKTQKKKNTNHNHHHDHYHYHFKMSQPYVKRKPMNVDRELFQLKKEANKKD